MRRFRWICLLIIAAACGGPGPLPAIPPHLVERKSDWFRSSGEDPLELDNAIRSNDIGRVRALLDAGANPNQRWGQSGDHFPLQEVLDTGGGYSPTPPAEFVRLLLAHGADPNQRWCPFESRGPSAPGYPTCTSAKGTTPLLVATTIDFEPGVSMLLEAGADPLARDWFGESALDYATNEIVFELISRSMFPDPLTRDRQALDWLTHDRARNALELAASLDGHSWFMPPPPPPPPSGHAPIPFDYHRNRRVLGRIWSLLRIGADPNGRINEAGTTVLMLFASKGNYQAAKLLLSFGADPNLRDRDGRTAADVAASDEIRKLLTAAPRS